MGTLRVEMRRSPVLDLGSQPAHESLEHLRQDLAHGGLDNGRA
jgi:hypothetical protein